MKIFVSADIEGTAGITLWDETSYGNPRYAYFADQMSRECSAACRGALAGGATELVVKDAHGSACNLNPRMLPEEVKLFRGWGSDAMSMMMGLTRGFDGVFFTGYHSAAGMDTNPLSHTMNTRNCWVRINGQIAPELMINSLTASYLGVPVRLVTGDKGLCDWMRAILPDVETVAVSEGFGRGSLSIHPDKAIRLIREAAERAMAKPAERLMFPLPEHFKVEIRYKDHFVARNARTYPGVRLCDDPYQIEYECDDYMDVLRMIDNVL